MTYGRREGGRGMASFMTKKKKYKFQVEICLEELLEVPFVSAVLFAKLRLFNGGSFQDHSSRQEVRDHKVHWNSTFTFPCKMMANASTGVMERCVLRISIRKESKGGRSFHKLGFVDLNLAEFAGAGVIRKKALLEGYDAKHRQDNSMLKFKIELNMVSGDILFKAPSPSLKNKQIPVEDTATTEQRSDEFSGGSLAGSIASGSSGFGSLPKKRPQLLTSELVINQTLPESLNPSLPVTIATDLYDPALLEAEPISCPASYLDQSMTGAELPAGHSRNSSNTSQLSKASGYSSAGGAHSRQSSSGDSVTNQGHVRNPSAGSLALSDTGSLDRGSKQAGYDRRMKPEDGTTAPCRVENTRVDTDVVIEELLKSTNLEPTDDDSAETSGLQLFIAKDGTAALGNHEVKTEMSTGGRMFQQVVMDNR